MKADRVQAFSDGIFAILITILVLEFRLPDHSAGALAPAVLRQWPILFSYVLTFSYIGILWLFHHDLFGYMEKTTPKLNVLNLVSIFLTTLLNYSMSLLADSLVSGNKADMQFSFALYSAVAMGISLSYYGLYSYIGNHREMLSAEAVAGYFSSARHYPLMSAAVYAMAFLLSLLSAVPGSLFLLLGIAFHGYAYWKTVKIR
ncbi:MAG: DUF1211 domain-containing protein [Lachnospiraceae bacterium]|nr:DUF1211 domain-containing protein [Lachnospiraceae bacterium]